MSSPTTPAKLLVLEVPVPPSLHNLYERGRGGKRAGQHHSAVYEAWLWRCAALLGRTPPAPLPCAVRIVLRGGLGFSPGADLDNRIKPLIDLLRWLRVIPDDTVRQVVRIEACYEAPASEGAVASCLVEVRPA